MNVIETALPGVTIIRPVRHGDARGFFSETYNRRDLHAAGIDIDFVQDSHSRSEHAGTVRGLHYQIAPHAQAKLMRVIRGAVFDVALDIRRDSPTFGRHVSTVLSADSGDQIFVPVGFAHGFCTLEPGTEVLYKISAYYAPEAERGILWCDPTLEIDWPISPETATVSERDRKHPRWNEVSELF